MWQVCYDLIYKYFNFSVTLSYCSHFGLRPNSFFKPLIIENLQFIYCFPLKMELQNILNCCGRKKNPHLELI